MFCRHDWVPFRESTEFKHNPIKITPIFSRQYYRYEHYYSTNPHINPKTGKKIATDWNHSLGYHKDPVTDDVCSKCFKMRLNLQKALEKSIKREKARDKARAKEHKRNTEIDNRRSDAHDWATKFVSMKDKG